MPGWNDSDALLAVRSLEPGVASSDREPNYRAGEPDVRGIGLLATANVRSLRKLTLKLQEFGPGLCHVGEPRQ